MYFPIIFKREVRDTALSSRFLLSLILMLLPVAIGAWFSNWMYKDSSIIAKITGMLYTKADPGSCMMMYAHIAPLPIALVAILHASDFIAGEEARGMLLLLSSKPLHRWEIVAGKYLSFLAVFLPLIALNTVLLAFSLSVLGIGTLTNEVLLGYIVSFFSIGVVYTSIATLFSSMTNKTLAAVLATFLFLILWYIFDWMLLYLPWKTVEFLEKFSLSYYLDNILGYISEAKAALLLRGAMPTRASPGDFLHSAGVIFIALGMAPVIISAIILEKRDIYGR